MRQWRFALWAMLFVAIPSFPLTAKAQQALPGPDGKPSDSSARLMAPCEDLHRTSQIIRRALLEINSPIEERGTPTYRIKMAKANAAIDAVRRPFTFGGPSDPFVFKPADFDGDGRIDKMTSSCGNGEDRICFLKFDRGDGKPKQLQKGFMYLTRVGGHFYAVWDYYASEVTIRSGGTKNNYSEYYRVTRHGFSEVCTTQPQGKTK